ncbi:MAG: arsenite methyltransferase [Chloroflexota bacterium]|nr:arsenite methyltransferase [Dehalococcoidia bacterium]MDW8252466.1 arsenite methyltransferase [Chloroflexota bacterium]
MTKEDQVRAAVREKYAAAALAVLEAGSAACCSSSCGAEAGTALYRAEDLRDLPAGAVNASLGCGNPTALIDLRPGEIVLDLGSGGGLDVLLSARRVGPTGKVYGVDMTEEMLDLARRNAREAGAENVEFLRGTIEAVPLPDASVDVVISNCVINLSTDKAAVLREAFRVLRPGGRFAVTDVVVQGRAFGPATAEALALWAGCIAGALLEEEYHRLLAEAGFVDVAIEELAEYGRGSSLQLEPGQRIISAFVRARKPL